jgi:hypothetical protein
MLAASLAGAVNPGVPPTHRSSVRRTDMLQKADCVFSETEIRRAAIGDKRFIVYETNWNPWHADPQILHPTLRVKPRDSPFPR